jgi:FdhD protein
MVLKCAHMGIPILVSRSGFTAWGVELARKVNMTLIGRARGRRFVALSGTRRIVYDAAPEEGPEEDERLVRKGARRGRRGVTPA